MVKPAGNKQAYNTITEWYDGKKEGMFDQHNAVASGIEQSGSSSVLRMLTKYVT